MMPAEAFDTPTQRKILRVLTEKNRFYGAEELSELCHRSKSMVSRSLSAVCLYPFVRERRMEGTRRKLYGLDSDSVYAEPISRFFAIERERERQNGTIPVDVWNLLEDFTVSLSDGIDGFLELYLFGSYATGEYYAGSDIDLILVVDAETMDDGEKTAEIHERARERLDTFDSTVDTQLFIAPYDGTSPTSDDLRVAAQTRASVPDGEPLIALWGDES